MTATANLIVPKFIFYCRMPAYDANQWYALFFVVFLIINLYIFMNVLLAVIFNSYKNNLKVSALTHIQKQVVQHSHDAIFHWNFQKHSVKILYAVSVSGNSQIMHCGKLINMPYFFISLSNLQVKESLKKCLRILATIFIISITA